MPQGAGGLGAISVGISEILVEYLLIAVPMLIINFAVRGIARRRGASAQRFRRAHLILSVAYGAIVILTGFRWESIFQRGEEALLTTLGTSNLLWFAFLFLQAAFLLWAVTIAAGRARKHLASSR